MAPSTPNSSPPTEAAYDKKSNKKPGSNIWRIIKNGTATPTDRRTPPMSMNLIEVNEVNIESTIKS